MKKYLSKGPIFNYNLHIQINQQQKMYSINFNNGLKNIITKPYVKLNNICVKIKHIFKKRIKANVTQQRLNTKGPKLKRPSDLR